MSTNISGAALDFLRNKFGATIDRQEARELGIKKDEDFEAYDIDASDDLDIDDTIQWSINTDIIVVRFVEKTFTIFVITYCIIEIVEQRKFWGQVILITLLFW